jgi:hypothetical protein
VLPLSSTLDTPGPLARSVEDAALIFRVLNGPDPRDPQTLAWTPADPLPTLRRGVDGLRLAVLPDAERVGVETDVLNAYDASVEALAAAGARIVRLPLPHRFSDYAAATGRIIGAEGYRFVGHLVDDPTLPTDPHVRPRIQLGRDVSARDYLLTLAEREEHRRQFATALADVDAALERRDVSAAEQAWRSAHGVAIRARDWRGLVDVGDAALRIARVAGYREPYVERARKAYLDGFVRAKADRSVDGVLRVRDAFAALGDHEVARQCALVAEALTPAPLRFVGADTAGPAVTGIDAARREP